MAGFAGEPSQLGGSDDDASPIPENEVLKGPAVCEYIKDTCLGLQRMAEQAGCPELAMLLARAAAEAHHQAEERKL